MKRKKLNILILDDDNSFRAVISEAVRRAGYTVYDYASPEDALNHVKIKPVDFAVIDCMLPKKNGIQVIQEMRMLGLDELPVCIISGIFKDKSFIQSSRQKTNAVEFFTKPFNIADLLTCIEEQVKVKAVAPAVSKAMILTNEKATLRDKSKYLDRAELLTGKDIPVLLKLFSNKEISGSLNFISEDYGIFGINISNGEVENVESENSIEAYKSMLLYKNLMDEDDFSSLATDISRGDVLNNLVNANFVSPHMYSELKIEFIVRKLNEILNYGSLQVGFSKVDSAESDDKVTLSKPIFDQFVLDCTLNRLDDIWLNNFFEDLEACEFKVHDKTIPIELKLTTILKDFDINLFAGKPVEDVLFGPLKDIQAKRAVFLLSMLGVVTIEKSDAVVSSPTEVNRLQSLYEILSTRNPIETFRYFGASQLVSNAEVEKIYRDLAKTYHPDMLSEKATPEHKELIHEIFAIVTNAHAILTNSDKRDDLELQLQQKDAEKQLKSDAILEDGVKELKKGRVNEAIILLEISNELYSNLKSKLYIAWAKMKQASGSELDEVTFDTIKHLLASTASEDRKMGVYHHVAGLFAKYRGDIATAQASFQKALSTDGGFIESRRELASLGKINKATEASTISEMLTGDISVVISNLFKKKSS